jgi:hypothetical protein
MYLPRSNKIYLAEDGLTEIVGPGYEDRRLWIITIMDPCDLAGLVAGRDKKDRYWETHERGVSNRVVHLEAEAELGGMVVKNKATPWALFKRAFLTDRGRQGKEVGSAGGVVKAADIERGAGQLQEKTAAVVSSSH